MFPEIAVLTNGLCILQNILSIVALLFSQTLVGITSEVGENQTPDQQKRVHVIRCIEV